MAETRYYLLVKKIGEPLVYAAEMKSFKEMQRAKRLVNIRIFEAPQTMQIFRADKITEEDVISALDEALEHFPHAEEITVTSWRYGGAML